MTVEIRPDLLARVQPSYFVWLTTVRADGMPQPTPVWFIYEPDGTFLVYTQPHAQKLRNIQQNPQVALSFAFDDHANEYAVVMGEAKVDDTALPLHLNIAYLDKYRAGIVNDLNTTPDQLAAAFTAAIRVTPTRVRGD